MFPACRNLTRQTLVTQRSREILSAPKILRLAFCYLKGALMLKNVVLNSLVSVVIAASALMGSAAHAESANGLVINAAEVGIGKFHRKGNSVHTYAADSAWYGYVLPQNANPTQSSPALQQKNADGSYTIFFSSLDELLTTAVALSKSTNTPIAILNLEAHGMPGGMWYPKDQAERDSGGCSSWRDNAYGTDEVNYDQYYHPVAKSDIDTFRQMSQFDGFASMQPCVSTQSTWKEEITKTGFAAALANNAEIHFISCIVGLGVAGEHFTSEVAGALFTGGKNGKVLTSVNFGLGDWSIPEGMGFWDYISMDQLDRDNDNYVKHQNDREIAQAGTVRIAAVESGKANSGLFGVPNKFLAVNGPVSKLPPQTADLKITPMTWSQASRKLPAQVRLPHTATWIRTR